MQSRPLCALPQDHLDRLRDARRLRPGGRATGAAVHLPLTPRRVGPTVVPRAAEEPEAADEPEAPDGRRFAGTRSLWPPRRLLAVAVLTPALLALLLVGSRGAATVIPAGWTALAVLVAGTSAATLATYVPLPGTGRRLDLGCSPCASIAALSALVAVAVVVSTPHDVPSAILGLGVAGFGLRQRLTGPGGCAV